MSANKPYIDAEYYINNYKASKNARIQGTFNNVDMNKMNFDSFRKRASEVVDRLLSGKITDLGGLDRMSDTQAKELIKLSTAAFVEKWFIKGFVMSDLNSMLNLGSLSAQNVMKIENFRNIVPFSALANLQKTGMWDHKAVGVNLSTELHDAGIDPSEIVTWGDAIAAFELKDEGLNFHVEGDMSGELTGMAGQKRWIKILETPQLKSSFEIIGGTDEFTKTNIEFQRDGNGNVTKAEALIYSAVLAPDAAGWWYKVEDGKTIIYMEVEDDQDETRFAISNAYPDEEGIYGVLGSVDNSVGLTEMNKVSIIDSIANVSIKTITEYPDRATFDAEAESSIGYYRNADGSWNILVKTSEGTKEFKDFESISAALQIVFDELRDETTIAQETADAALAAAQAADGKAEQNKQDITSNKDAINLKQDEVNLGTDGNKLIKKTGTFSSKDLNGVRQPAVDDDDLTDKEFVEEITTPLEARTTELERKDGDNLKRDEAKSPVNTSNKIITEKEHDALETNLGNRVEALEDAESLDDKVWEGSKPFSAAGEADLTGIVDQNGAPFVFDDGKSLQIFIKHSGDNIGKDGIIKINDGTPIAYVIPSGNASDTLAVQIADTGLASASITNGNDNEQDFEIYKVVESAATKDVNKSYTKTESDAKYATKQEGQLATELGAKNVSGNRDLSDLADNNNKENIIATEEYVDTEAAKKVNIADIEEISVVIPAKYGWVEKTEAELNVTANLGKRVRISFTNNGTEILAGELSKFDGRYGFSNSNSTTSTCRWIYQSGNPIISENVNGSGETTHPITKIELWDVVTPEYTMKFLGNKGANDGLINPV